MKKFHLILTNIALIIFIAFFFVDCKKKMESPSSTAAQTDSSVDEKEVGLTTSDGEEQLWESLPVDSAWELSEQKTIDGQNLQAWISTHPLNFQGQPPSSLKIQSESSSQPTSIGEDITILIGRCKYAALKLSLRNSSQVSSFHATFPQVVGQDRLAYVWGAKDINKKHLCNDSPPSDNSCNCPNPALCACSSPLYGLDCSGFIKWIFNAASVNLTVDGTVNLAKIENWNDALDNSIYSGVKMVDVTNTIQSPYDCCEGDIVVRSGHHLGMVFDTGNGRVIFSSLGSYNYLCSRNSDINHGPISLKPDSKALNNLWGLGYKVFRLTNPKSQYSLSSSLTINLTFYGSISNPSFGYTQYYLTGIVLDSQSQIVPGVTVAFTSDVNEYYQFDHATMTTPDDQDRLYLPGEYIPVLSVSATMPDGTFLTSSRQPSFQFNINTPPLIFDAAGTKITTTVVSKSIN